MRNSRCDALVKCVAPAAASGPIHAATLYQAIGSQVGTSNVCITLAQLAAAKGDLQAAITYLQPAADFCRSIGHPLGDQLQAQIDAWREQLSG